MCLTLFSSPAMSRPAAVVSLFTLWAAVPVASILLVFAVALTNGCIVHNCPVGGKRSEIETQPIRQVSSTKSIQFNIRLIIIVKLIGSALEERGSTVQERILRFGSA